MTTVLPPREAKASWNPIRNGGACVGSPYDFQPDLVDEDANVPVPTVIQQLCAFCPFKDECLKWAMDNDAYGYWAGTSRYQRLQLDKKAHRVKCPGCGSAGVMEFGGSEVCMSCGMSWLV